MHEELSLVKREGEEGKRESGRKYERGGEGKGERKGDSGRRVAYVS